MGLPRFLLNGSLCPPEQQANELETDGFERKTILVALEVTGPLGVTMREDHQQALSFGLFEHRLLGFQRLFRKTVERRDVGQGRRWLGVGMRSER